MFRNIYVYSKQLVGKAERLTVIKVVFSHILIIINVESCKTEKTQHFIATGNKFQVFADNISTFKYLNALGKQ